MLEAALYVLAVPSLVQFTAEGLGKQRKAAQVLGT